MSVLSQLASAMNRRDEEPNEALAVKLCDDSETREVAEDVQELVDNLRNRDKAIRSDCIKVLYEIGGCNPALIANYVDEFVWLLGHKDNRLVWGAMTAFGSLAALRANEIWEHVDAIIDATETGSVITQDWGIRVLATVAAHHDAYATQIFPFLIGFLRDCRPKDVPRHAESIMPVAISSQQQAQLRDVLDIHRPSLKPSQLKRVERILKQLS